jgi:hypothetical protein
MKKFKLKVLLIIFFILLVIQFIIVLAEILLSQANSGLTSITSALIGVCSLPISLINGNLPFYVTENIFMVGVYWVINVIIQSVLVYAILIVVKKIQSSN